MAKPGSDPLQRTALPGLQRPLGAGTQLWRHTAAGGVPGAEHSLHTVLPAGLAWKTHADLHRNRDMSMKHVTQHTMKEHDTKRAYFMPSAPTHVLHFIWKHGYLARGWICYYLFSIKKRQSFLSTVSLLPWQCPVCHKQAPAFQRQSSEWALTWVKVLIAMNFLLAIKHKGAQILNVQLKFKTVSDLSSPHTLITQFQSTSSEERKKQC